MKTILTTVLIAITGLLATAQTPQLFKDIYPGAKSGGGNTDTLSNLIVYNNALYFGAYSNNHASTIWKSDGTAAGTDLFMDIQGAFGSGRCRQFILSIYKIRQ